MRRACGFTLIELLIVVAIIAILAAIAVPNFLEAQTRSKVSRAKADMYSVATALEVYRIDTNHYPVNEDCEMVYRPGPDEDLREVLPDVLTTPVSYLTSLPKDPFAKYSRKWGFGQMVPTDEVMENKPSIIWRYSYLGTEALEGYLFFDFAGYWTVYTFGPSDWYYRTRELIYYDDPVNGLGLHYIYYDPTNGTLSRGIIARTQRSSDSKP
jgi:type II secretion system protein G